MYDLRTGGSTVSYACLVVWVSHSCMVYKDTVALLLIHIVFAPPLDGPECWPQVAERAIINPGEIDAYSEN